MARAKKKTLYELTKPPEKDIKAFVINYLESKGYLYIRLNNVRMTQKAGQAVRFLKLRKSQVGAPDFFVFTGTNSDLHCPIFGASYLDAPWPIAIETKRVGKDLSTDQNTWRERWEAMGGEYLIVRTPEDLTGRL